MDTINSELGKDYRISLSFASVGGFFESYTFITRNEVFANSQTGNVARIGIFLAKRDFALSLRFLLPVLAFLLGVWIATRLRFIMRDQERPLLSYGQIITLIEIGLVFAVGLFPAGRLDVPVTVLISFVCAIQVQAFRQFDDNPFSSTMCTGNLRSGTEKLHQYYISGQKESLFTAFRYYLIDVVFCLSAMVGVWVTDTLGTKAVWVAVIPLIILFVVFTMDKYRTFSNENAPR